MKTLMILALALASVTTMADVITLCGVRSGTAGEVYLANSQGKLVVELSHQGGSQKLADQADELIEGGMQNRSQYCVNAKRNQAGKVIKIVGAYKKSANIKTICGKRSGTAGEVYLTDTNGKVVLELANQGGSQTLADQADEFIEGGMQNGSKYCLNAKSNKAGKVIKIIGAFKN
jgi:hypothetical protein